MAGGLQMYGEKIASLLRDIIQYLRLSVLIRGSPFSSCPFAVLEAFLLILSFVNRHCVPVRVKNGGHLTPGKIQRFNRKLCTCLLELVNRLIEISDFEGHGSFELLGSSSDGDNTWADLIFDVTGTLAFVN